MDDTDEFLIEAQAILDEAPDYKTGTDYLLNTYNNTKFTRPEEAAIILSSYGEKLGQKFADKGTEFYNYETSKAILPIPLDQIEGDSPMERINTWQKENEAAINSATDSDTILLKSRLLESAKRAAISERRKLNGKDTLDEFEARQAAVTKNESLGGASLRAFIGGLIPDTGFLNEGTETQDYYNARKANESFGEGLTQDVAGGAGVMAQMTAAGMTGGAIGGAIGGPAAPATALAGATIGVGLSMGVMAINAIKNTFQASEERTGDYTKAVGAGAIETGGQVVSALIGGKAIRKTGERIIGKTLGTLKKEAIYGGTQAGLAVGIQSGVSEAAHQVGGVSDPSILNIVKSTGKGALIGGMLGSTHAAGTQVLGTVMRPPVDKFKSDTNTIKNVENPAGIQNEAITKSIVDTKEGVTEVSPLKEEVKVPYDNTYKVSEETANKIQILKDSVDPDGEAIKIYSDTAGNLVVDNIYVDKNLGLQDTPQNVGKVTVKDEAGDHVVGVNAPRVDADGSTIYNSKVLGKDAGAAHIESMGKEKGKAKNIREDTDVDPRIREQFGSPEGPGLFRYYNAETLAETGDIANKTIDELGIEKAVTKVLKATPEESNTREGQALAGALGNRLFGIWQEAVKAGDDVAADAAILMLHDVNAQFVDIGTDPAQALSARRIFKDQVQETVAIQRALAKQEARREAALESKIPIEELRNTEKDLESVTDDLTVLSRQEDPQIIKTDKDIQDAEAIIKDIDKGAEEQVKIEQKQIEEKVTQAETELKDLEVEAKARTQEIEKQAKDLEKQIADTEKEHQNRVQEYNKKIEATKKKNEAHIKALEKKGLEQARKNQDERIAKETTTLEKVKNNKRKGAKVKDETIKKAEEFIATEKKKKVTSEDGLTPEERALFRKLKSDNLKLAEKEPATTENLITKAEKVKLEKLKTLKEDFGKAKAGTIPPKVQARQNLLKEFIREQKQKASSITHESKLGTQKKNQKLKLTGVVDALKTKREGLSSKFNAETKAKYDELTKKADILRERKKNIDKKTKEKFEDRLPQSDIQKLQELVAAQKLLPEGASAKERIQSEIDDIKHKAARSYQNKMKTFTEKLSTFYLSQLFFRVSTFTKNIAANAFNVGMNAGALTVTGAGGQALTALGVKGYEGYHVSQGFNWLSKFLTEAKSSGFGDAIDVMKTGRESVRPYISTSDGQLKIKGAPQAEVKLITDKDGNVTVSTKRAGYADPVSLLKEVPYVGKYIAPLGLALRSLAAGDAPFTRGGIEADAWLIADIAAREKGLKGNDLKTEVAEKLFNTKTDQDNALTQARNEAEVLAKVGVKQTENEIISNAWSIMERQRDADLRATSTYSAAVDFYRQDVVPRGLTGFLFGKITQIFSAPIPLKGGAYMDNPLRLVQPVVGTMMKVANVAINSTPLGTLKAGFGKYAVGETGIVTRKQLGASLIGSTTMAMLANRLLANEPEDKNPDVNITAGIPTEPNAKALFYASGRKPWTIKLGGNHISFLNTPLFGPLGAVALWNEKRQTDDHKADDLIDTLGILTAGSMHAFSDITSLKATTDLLEALMTGEAKSGNALKNTMAGITKNLLIPYVAVAEEFSAAYNNPVNTRNNFWAKVFGNIPFAGGYSGEPLLNLFGEPVEKDWYNKIPFVGKTIGTYYGGQTNDPDVLWLINNGYSVAGIENKIVIDSKDPKYDDIKMKRAEKFGLVMDNVFTDKEATELQKVVGPQYREIVSKYRNTYGDGKFDEKVQEKLRKELLAVKNREKYRLFVESVE